MKRPRPTIRLAAVTLYSLAFTTYIQAQIPSTVAAPLTMRAHQVAVGDHRLYLSCAGEGHPTVGMEAGYGDSSDVWAAVQPRLATFTRVCVYDRAGLGRSDVVGNRTVRDVVNDSEALLSGAAADGPVVLVGHSIGGLIATMVVHERPEMVAGLVLVDSSHPDQQPRLHSRLPQAWLEALDTFFADTPAFET